MAKEKTDKVYVVGDLAEELGVADATARVMLRAAEIEKSGKQYEWNETQFKKVVSQLSKRSKAEPKEDKKSKGKPVGKAARAKSKEQEAA